MWRGAFVDSGLLYALLSFLHDDDVYRFWVFAEENRLDGVDAALRSNQFDDAPFSATRARYLAMGYACWTAVCRFTTPRPTSQRLSRRVVDHIVRECPRLEGSAQALAFHLDRERAMLTAAPVGSMPAYVMYFAVERGNVESVLWLHCVARYDPPEALRVAARRRHDHLVVWLLENAPTARWDRPADCSVEWVFRYEDDVELDILVWRVMVNGKSYMAAFSPKWGFADATRGQYAEYGVVDLPASHGDLDAMKRMLAHGVFENDQPQRTARHAATGGHLHVLRWLFGLYPTVFDNGVVLAQALSCGQLEVAQWIASHGIKERQHLNVTYRIVKNGHVRVLRWLAEAQPDLIDQSLDDHFTGVACEKGHFDIVRWYVHERNVQITNRHVEMTASGGQLLIFCWLIQRLRSTYQDAFEWEEEWLDDAAASGDLLFVKWLVQDCGAWSPSACAAASTVEIAEFLHSFALRHNKQQIGLRRLMPPLVRDGLFEALTWQLQHGQRIEHLWKDMFNKINDFETNFARTQAHLGWSSYTPFHQYWPRTYERMARLRELVRVVIDVCSPDFLRQLVWLPRWAVLFGTIANLERLVLLNHPEVLAPRTFRLLLRSTKNAGKVQWFITKAPLLFTPRVVRWAVQRNKLQLLTWVYRELLPAREDSAAMTFRCSETARWFAHKHGRLEVVSRVLAGAAGSSRF